MNFFKREETVAKTKYDKMSEDYNKLYYRNHDLQVEYNEIKNENEKLKNENEKLKNQIKEKEERLQTIESHVRTAKNRELNEQRKNLKGIIEEHKIRGKKQKKQIDILKQENDELKEQLDALDTKRVTDDFLGFSIMNPMDSTYYFGKNDIQNLVNSFVEKLKEVYKNYEELLQLFNNKKTENYNLSQRNNELKAINVILREKLKQNVQTIEIYDADNKQRIFDSQDEIQNFIDAIYSDFKLIKNERNYFQNKMADLQKILNETQLKAQNVQTIEIHNPVNNSTVDQKETIQEAIDNIYNLYLSTKTSSNLYMQMVEDFRK